MNQLYKGNALEILRTLPDSSVDAVITDPPYSSGGLHIGSRTKAPSQKYTDNDIHADFSGDNLDQRSWFFWCGLWIEEVVRVLKPGGYFMMFSDWRQLPTATDALQIAGITWRGVITWDKGPAARAPHKGYFRHQAEFIPWGSKGSLPKATHAGPYPGVIKCPVIASQKLHMTGKPVPLMEELVKAIPPGGVILDPFMGSASTGVACQNLGREFIGIEKTEHYFQVSENRLNAQRA